MGMAKGNAYAGGGTLRGQGEGLVLSTLLGTFCHRQLLEAQRRLLCHLPSSGLPLRVSAHFITGYLPPQPASGSCEQKPGVGRLPGRDLLASQKEGYLLLLLRLWGQKKKRSRLRVGLLRDLLPAGWFLSIFRSSAAT